MADALWMLHEEEGLNSTPAMVDVRTQDRAASCSSEGSDVFPADKAVMVQRDQPKRKWLAERGSRGP